MIGRNSTNSGCTTVQADEYKAGTALTVADNGLTDLEWIRYFCILIDGFGINRYEKLTD